MLHYYLMWGLEDWQIGIILMGCGGTFIVVGYLAFLIFKQKKVDSTITEKLDSTRPTMVVNPMFSHV